MATIFQTLTDCAAGLADLLLPVVCPACGSAPEAADGLCRRCNRMLLSLVSLPYCRRCGATVGPNIPVRDDGCAGCPTTLPRFARTVRLGPYHDPLRGVIRDLKYHRRDMMRRRLGRLLGQAVAGQCRDESFDLALAVPMHWRRRLVRGTDHAATLAKAVAGQLKLPAGDELIRIRHTPPQAYLPRSRRIQNVRGAFAVRRADSIAGANVLLIDDVTTTGATANEAAGTLLKAGAARVCLAVVAKSEPPTAYGQHFA
ncbi:MAG: ComF family protein [Planctomycetota bacterium]|nr:ComF family protein [Planctomycetota bacterium]